LPLIHAAIILCSATAPKDADKAIEALAAAAPYELGQTALPLFPVYLRAEAYLVAHQGAAAATQFQMVLDHSSVVRNEQIVTLAHLGLARAYALSRDTAKARTKYQAFFALWNNADSDIPILKQAKAEFARLQ
jgi:hypothetical protein